MQFNKYTHTHTHTRLTGDTFIPHASSYLQTGSGAFGTRRLRSQDPVSVHAHCTEGTTESERREGANEAGGGIGVGGGKGDRNRGRGGNVNISGDGNGDIAGMRTGVEANYRTQDGIGDGSGDRPGTETGTGVETRERTQDGCRTGAGTGAGT